jgi:hypothetical protein
MVPVAVDAAASAVDTVVEEDRTTLAPGWQLRAVSVLHLVTMCLIMDTVQLRIRWELRGKQKLVQFVGTNYGQDISNELQNKIPVILPKPVHTPEVLARHAIREQMVQSREENLQRASLSSKVSHPRSFSRFWSWPWCTNATWDFG